MIAVDANAIPWAAIGAGLAGVGSFLTGLAAYRTATRKEPDEPKSEDRGDADQ